MSSVLATGARTGRWIKRTSNLGGSHPRLMHRIEYLHLYKSGGRAGDGGIGKPRDSLVVAHVHGLAPLCASFPLHHSTLDRSSSVFPIVGKRRPFSRHKGKEGLRMGVPKRWTTRRSSQTRACYVIESRSLSKG